MFHINLGVCSFTPPFICYVHQQIQGTSLKIVGVGLKLEAFLVDCCLQRVAKLKVQNICTYRSLRDVPKI